MKTAQHTPGPWFRNIRAGGKYPTVYAGRNQHVAAVCQQATPEETEANIDLVAAAPEMLAALERLLTLSRTQGVTDEEWEAAEEAGEAAIAKASGR